jgi:transcriptional regulator with XRE-family HTH domain
MNKVKKKIRGRPPISEAGVDLVGIGRRIRELRGQVTQEELARTLGISQAQLSKYEAGQTAPPLGVLAKLTKWSGRTTDWILTGTT